MCNAPYIINCIDVCSIDRLEVFTFPHKTLLTELSRLECWLGIDTAGRKRDGTMSGQRRGEALKEAQTAGA